MPEGDTVAGHARLLGSVLTGKELVTVGGSATALRRRSAQILGATVADVRSVGKHLVIALSTGYAVRVHLGMTGRWRVTAIDDRPHGSARVVLGTDDHLVACYAAPTVEVERIEALTRDLGRVGPDLLGEFDETRFLERARAAAERRVAEMLLDQRVLAGVGNVYKSELLFLGRIHPDTSVSDLTDARLLDLARRAERLLTSNVGKARSTTGFRPREHATWVYGRGGKPCRRCGTAVEVAERAGRLTYWCPACQPVLGQRNTI